MLLKDQKEERKGKKKGRKKRGSHTAIDDWHRELLSTFSIFCDCYVVPFIFILHKKYQDLKGSYKIIYFTFYPIA